jgi:protocatechuate 3,4-dioxygenase beta subunit
MDRTPRREFIRAMGLGSLFFTVPGLFAEELVQNPRQTEGPFYPDKLPLDTDNDLLRINDSITPGVGEITWVSGRILSLSGAPIRNATVEIWQCDANGAYLHTGTVNKSQHDSNFQGFGRFVTSSTGEYVVRTIKPVPYPGRTPHIHFLVKAPGAEKFTTQCYIKGHPQNERDGIWKGVKDPKQREAITVDFAPLPGSKTAELAAHFDVVLGVTPEV